MFISKIDMASPSDIFFSSFSFNIFFSSPEPKAHGELL